MTHTESFTLFQLTKDCERAERAAVTARKRYEDALEALLAAERDHAIALRDRLSYMKRKRK